MITDIITCHTNIDIKNPVYSKFGDVLIPASDTTPTGIARATSVEKEGVLLGSDINIIRPESGIHGSCLSLSMNANKAKMLKYIKGITVRHIHNSDIKELKIFIPENIKEQELLAIYFKNLDRLITLNRHKLSAMKEYKKSMLQRMFPKAGNSIPELRFPGFSDDWVERKLGDVCGSFEYGLNVAAKKFDGKHQYMRITDIDEDSREFIKDKLTSPKAALNNIQKYRLEKNDIVFARTGASVGKTYIYKETDGLIYYAGFLIRARVKPTASAEFIFQNTHRHNYKEFIRIESQRSGQPGVNSQQYFEYSFQYPSLPEQSLIGSFFFNLDRLISLHAQKLAQMDLYKKALLQRMFC